MNKRIKNLLSEINKARKDRFKACPLPSVMQMPVLPLDHVAKIIINQRDFVEREILTQNLLEFYAFNTNDFTNIVTQELRDTVKFDEKYIDECVSEIAELIQDGKVYKTPNGIFTAWHTKKDKHTKGILTVDEAIKTCSDMLYGGI